MSQNKVLGICLLGFCCFPSMVFPLKITSLDVPKSAWDSVKLNCKYDLEGGILYNVKWYKDGREFFRCQADGKTVVFPLKEISVYRTEMSQVGSCFFELTAHDSRSAGEYMCEVSLDWPTFEIVTKSAHLEIEEPELPEPQQTSTELTTATLPVSEAAISLSDSTMLSVIFCIIHLYLINKHS